MSSPSVNRLAEAMAAERDPKVPEHDLTAVGRMRRALFNGEALQPRTAVERFGGSNGLLGQVAYQLEVLGFHVDRTPGEDGFVAYRLIDPEYQPTERDFERARAKSMASKKSPKSKKRAQKTATAASNTPSQALVEVEAAPLPSTTGRGSEGVHGGTLAVPVLPGLGQPVSIYAQVLNTDGTITLGLRNGSRSWLTTVTGVVEVEDEA